MQFAVFGLPRSGTTWAANWLTDGGAICLHDPIGDYAPTELAALDLGRPWGVSCTGLWVFDVVPEGVPVVILERDEDERYASVAEIGFDVPEGFRAWERERFARVKGLRVPFADLFNEAGARRIWGHLRQGEPFDVLRWRMLRDVRVEPIIERMMVCAGTVEALRREFERGV